MNKSPKDPDALSKLSPEQHPVTQQGATEYPGNGEYLYNNEPASSPLHHATGCRPKTNPMNTAIQGSKPARRSIRATSAVAVFALLATLSSAQSAKEICGASPLLAIANEPPAKLIVDPPLPGPLALGRVFIQYRTENLRVVPVFGEGALQVSPRLGHIHITVDDAPWHFVDANGGTLILVGLGDGPHKVLIELADPAHKVITSETVRFTLSHNNYKKVP